MAEWWEGGGVAVVRGGSDIVVGGEGEWQRDGRGGGVT